MTEEESEDDYEFDTADDSDVSDADRELAGEINELREEIDNRTLHRSVIENELQQYVRSRLRAGHARGWGPYLVLLYGTAMTISAFYFLSGGWAILAMIVIWLSTLGLYVLMVIFGIVFSLVSIPGRLRDRIPKPWR